MWALVTATATVPIRKRRLLASAALALASAFVSGGAADAQPRDLEPGSLLVFPFYDNRPGRQSVVTVTNTNLDRSVAGNGYKSGDVLVHYVYIGGEDWLEFDRSEFLTPGDMLCVSTQEHNPHGGYGFLYVYALDPETQAPIDFDHLLGDVLVIASDIEGGWSIQAVAFRGLPQGVPVPDPGTSGAGQPFTDADADGLRDFDGIEYDAFPAELYVPRFFEEGSRHETQLVLFTTFGPEFIVSTDLTILNNSEDRFSRNLRFSCWFAGNLSSVSGITGDLGGDPDEFRPAETGWLRISGGHILNRFGRREPAVPAFIGFVLENVGPVGDRIQAARLMNHAGARDGGSLR